MEPTSSATHHTVEDIIGGSDSDLTELSDEEPSLAASGGEAPPSSPVANVPPPRGREETYARRVNRNRIQSDDEEDQDHEGSESKGEVMRPTTKPRRGSPRDRTDPRKNPKRRSPAPDADVVPRIKISRDVNGDAVSASKTDDGKPPTAAGAAAGGKRKVTLKLKTSGDRGTPDHDQGREHSDTGAHEPSGKRRRPPPPSSAPSARHASVEREQERAGSPGDTGGGKRRERRDSQELVRRTDRERDRDRERERERERGDRDRPLKKPKRDRPTDDHDLPPTEQKRLKKIVRYDVDPRHTPGVEEFFKDPVKDSVGAGERGGKTPNKREEGRATKRDAGDPDGEKPRGKRDVDLDGEREGKRGGERRRRDGDESEREREEVHVSSQEIAPQQKKKKQRERVPPGSKVEDASSDVEITAVSVKKKSSTVKREDGKREDLDAPSTDPASRPKLQKRPGGERPTSRMAAISASGTRTPGDQGKPRTPHGADGSARRPGGGGGGGVQKKVQYDPLATALSGVMGGPSSGVSFGPGVCGAIADQTLGRIRRRSIGNRASAFLRVVGPC